MEVDLPSTQQVKARALATLQSLLEANLQYQRALKANLRVIRDRARQVQARQVRLYFLAAGILTLELSTDPPRLTQWALFLQRQLERLSAARLAALIQGQSTEDDDLPTPDSLKDNIPLNYAFTSFAGDHGCIPDFQPSNPPISQIPTAFLPVTWTTKESERLKSGVVNYCSFLALREGLVSLDDLESTSPIDLVSLIEDNSLAIDWHHVSAVYLRDSGKTPQDCMARWSSLDHVAFTQAGASEEELMRIRELVEMHDTVFDVASELETRRSPAWVYSMYRALTQMEAKERSTPWTALEDHLLHQAIALHGPSNGALVSSLVGTRSNRQCLQRWRRNAPSIVRGAWSAEDDAALLAAAVTCGITSDATTDLASSSGSTRTTWSDVAKLVVGRADNQCRDRYRWLTERRGKTSSVQPNETWARDMDRGLIDLVRDHGPRWALIGGIIGRPDALVAAQFARIVREMAAGERPDLLDVSLLELARIVEQDSSSLANMKAVVTRVVNAVNPEIPMFPTLASVCALTTAAKALTQFKSETTAPALNSQLIPRTVPRPVLSALYRTFAMTSGIGTCDPRPIGWAGVGSEREKQSQIAACRAMIEQANSTLGGEMDDHAAQSEEAIGRVVTAPL